MSNDNQAWLEDQGNKLPKGLGPRDVVLERMLGPIDLSKGHDQKQINPYGDMDLFLVTEIDGEAYVQFNSKKASKIPIHKVPKINREFNDVYLTNDPQPNSSFTVLLGGDLEGNSSIQASSISEMSSQFEIIETVGLKPADLKYINDDLAVALNNDEVGLFKTSDFTESRNIQTIPTIGSQANVWDNELTGVDTKGNIIDISNQKLISVFGNVDGACTLTMMVSQDGTNFYRCSEFSFNNSSAGDFHRVFEFGVKYISIVSDTDVTATTTIAGKA